MRRVSPVPERAPGGDDFRTAVREGLRRRPKSIPPKYFYDESGSRLFDLICGTPEYYPTRTEIAILERYGAHMAELAGTDCVLVELGSGSAVKTPLLLRHLSGEAAYVPIDICEPHLIPSTRRLQAMFPSMRMHPLCADYTELPALRLEGMEQKRRVVFFPGSTIGNYTPDEAVQMLRSMAQLTGEDGALLVGVDCKKPPGILNAAYNDAAGHTAAFNRNLLTRMQRELGAELDPDGFAHYACYNAALGRVEMHLISRGEQVIRLAGEIFRFEDGESIHTENSYKYTNHEFQHLARNAGWHSRMHWSDQDGFFSVHCLSRTTSGPRHLPQQMR